MVNLTFGEQVKIILSRKGMTIKQLAELVEQHTGKPMSRQNMTQRLGRDNFQEQDMRLIAEILGCKFQLSIMDEEEIAASVSKYVSVAKMDMEGNDIVPEQDPLAREITVGELVDIVGAEDVNKNILDILEESSSNDDEEHLGVAQLQEDSKKDSASETAGQAVESEERELLKKGVRGYFSKKDGLGVQKRESVQKDVSSEEEIVGDINPYTGKEYKTNSVRMHPKRIGYVQVYDQEQHKWTDMTEWAFLGYQERKKALLGKDYQPPIYLD